MSAEKVSSFRLNVQSPCSQPWGSMAGDDRSRHCTRCQLRVHDLSAMSKDDALKLIAGPDDQLCVRFNTRADGTAVLGCGDGWFRRALRVAGLAVMTLGFWTVVMLVQLPWLTISRKLSAPPSPPQPQVDPARAKREQLERQLAALYAKMQRDERRTMGAISSGERDRIREEVRRQRQSHAKR